MPEKKRRERPQGPGWAAATQLSSSPTQPRTPIEAELPLCNKPLTSRLLGRYRFPPQTPRGDAKAKQKPVTQQPQPIRWSWSWSRLRLPALSDSSPRRAAAWILNNSPCKAPASSLPSSVTLPRMPGDRQKPVQAQYSHWGAVSVSLPRLL